MKTLLPFLFAASFVSGCSFELDDCDFADDGGDLASSSSNVTSCPEGDICLDLVSQGGAVRTGRLAVVWFQVDQQAPHPAPEIALDRPLDAATAEDRRVVIASSSVAPPKNHDLLFCNRACDDEAACDCRGARVGVAMVVAADDVNEDGRLDTDEIRTASYGRGYFVLAHSEKDHPVAPRPRDAVFTDGIERGTAAYRFVGNPEERLAKARPGDALEVNLCAEPGRECELPFPTLGGF